MSQISEIEKLYAKPKFYAIPKDVKEGEVQIKVEITSLSLDDMSVLNMNKDMPISELAKNAKVIFARSLKVTEEEIAKISVMYMADILDAVMDANNFDEEDMKKTGLKEFIAQKQEQIKKEQDGKQTGKPEE